MDHVLLAALEFLNRPCGSLLRRLIFMILPLNALRKFKMYPSTRTRNCELHHHLRSKVIRREISPHLDRKLQLIRRQLVHKRIDSEWGRILTVNAVVHDQKFSVRRLNCHSPHVLKIARIHALMKVAIIQNHSPSCQVISSAANFQVVVQYKPEVRIALQVGLHLDNAIN